MTKSQHTAYGPGSFKTEFDKRLKGRSLKINKEMSMKALRLLVKNGLRMEKELLGPFDNAVKEAERLIESKKELEIKNIIKDAELVGEIAKKLLKECYPTFEEVVNDLSSVQGVDGPLQQLETKYTGISAEIKHAIRINSDSWKALKVRYVFTSLIIREVFSGNKNENTEEIKESALGTFYGLLMDNEKDPYQLVKKYTEKSQSGILGYFYQLFKDTLKLDQNHIYTVFNSAVTLSAKTPDEKFLDNLLKTKSFDTSKEIKQNIINEFLMEYSKWRKDVFPLNIKRIAPKYSDRKVEITKKYEEELLMKKHEIEEREFERIRLEIEGKFPTG
ncbi:1586_t:CDS:2 [Acaulospora colombiana]|uniref:1586_t:CDS:1 n=1 Tax=Acaulospora colombiana TaxID=27376 RepID=A0ACA9KZW4_9GLOM|nr:1586_t:CDS:2 [Acaulospora colombiana]